MRSTRLSVFLLIILCAPFKAPAQQDPTLDESPATVLRIAAPRPSAAWIELTHLPSDAAALLIDLEAAAKELEDEAADLVLSPDLPPGPTLLCSGATARAVRCERVYRGRAGETFAAPELEVTFEAGVVSRGRLFRDGLPISGALVAVVPAGLESPRAFTLPLEPEDGRSRREVATREDGVFELPALVAGRYFLEAHLPSGLLHRSEIFDLPDPAVLGQEFGLATEELLNLGLVWDLGDFEVPPGLTVEFVAFDPDDEPLAGVRVEAIQGRTPDDFSLFAGLTDAEGRAELSGFDPELPTRLRCEKEGYRPYVEEAGDLLPVVVRCVLEPWAVIFGAAITPEGTVPPGLTVAARRTEDGAGESADGGPTEPPAAVPAMADGVFEIGGLEAGEYEIQVAAPGFRTEQVPVTVGLGERIDLGIVALLYGRQLAGRVVDYATGERLAGVDVVSLDPPGAVSTSSGVEGDFSLTLGEAPMTVRFSTLDYAPLELEIDPAAYAPGDDLVVPLEAAGFVLVEIQGADGPCTGCQVVVRRDGGSAAVEWLTTDPRGEALSGPLLPGVFHVVRPRLTHFGSTVIEEPDAEAHRVRVEAGEVTRLRLEPLESTILVRFEPDLEGGPWMLSARTPLRSQKVHAGGGGEFSRDGDFQVDLSGESLDLYLHRFDPASGSEKVLWQATLPAAPRGDVFRVRRSRASIEGRAVGRERQPLAGAEVRLLDFVSSAFRGFVATGSNGVFEFSDVPPGVYTLMIGPRNVHFVSLRQRQRLDLGTFELLLDDPQSSSP